MEIVSRAYNQFSIDAVKGTITKSSETERILDEMMYLHNISDTSQSIYFPRILSVNKTLPYSFTSELYDYKDLGKYLIGDEYMASWDAPFTTINAILSDFDTVSIPDHMISYDIQEINANARAMYIDKTEKEYDALVRLFAEKYPNFNPNMFTNHGYEINGVLCDNFYLIWPSVKSYIESNLLTYTPVMIHGDCCLSNLLYGESHNVVRFVDPRGSFGVKGIYGDRRYDIAKLYHSVDGKYEFIINDKFELSVSATQYRMSYSRNDNPGKSAFEEIILSKYNMKDIKIIQGCIFISMAARHYDSLPRQEAMYFIGVKLLNEAMAL